MNMDNNPFVHGSGELPAPEEVDDQLRAMSDRELVRHGKQLVEGAETFVERDNVEQAESTILRAVETAKELSRRNTVRHRRDMRDLERGEFLPADEYPDDEEGRV
jgi:hypothetical protein